MSLVSIDTSTLIPSVALRTEQGQQFYAASDTENSHNEELPGLVERILEEAGLRGTDLGAILIGSGPGSFTGLRIGFSFAKGLALALNIPLISLSTLRSFAYQAFEEGYELVACVSDARRDELFGAIYQKDKRGCAKEILREDIYNLAQIEEQLKASGAKIAKDDKVAIYIGDEPSGFSSAFSVHKACEIAALLQKAYYTENAGTSCNNESFCLEKIAQLKPNYLRAVAAKTIEERRSLGLCKA